MDKARTKPILNLYKKLPIKDQNDNIKCNNLLISK